MENYVKGEVREVEEPLAFSLGAKDVHMRVAAGSKIRNLMGYAMKKVKEPDTKQLCWSGSGKAITKAVSCAEIMKRKVRGLQQITEIRNRRVEEYWEPKIEGLERLKVNRDIPAISILLSKEPLDKDQPGYQAPGSFDEFWKDVVQKDKSRSSRVHKKKPGPRNVLLDGAKGTHSDVSRNKINTNNENRKRKYQSERNERDKTEGGKQNEKESSDRNTGDNKAKSGKGTDKSGIKTGREANKSGAGSAKSGHGSQMNKTVTMETDT